MCLFCCQLTDLSALKCTLFIRHADSAVFIVYMQLEMRSQDLQLAQTLLGLNTEIQRLRRESFGCVEVEGGDQQQVAPSWEPLLLGMLRGKNRWENALKPWMETEECRKRLKCVAHDVSLEWRKKDDKLGFMWRCTLFNSSVDIFALKQSCAQETCLCSLLGHETRLLNVQKLS